MSLLKKTFFFSLFVLVISLLFWGVYNLAFQAKITPNKNISSSTKENSNSASATPSVEKIAPVSNSPVIAPAISKDGTNLEYISSGKLIQADFYGNPKDNTSSEGFKGVSKAIWSPDMTKMILKSGKEDRPSFLYYDISSGSIRPLKDNLDEVVWQTNADRIFYKYYDPKSGERTLNISDPDGTNWTKLSDLDYKNLSIASVPRTGLVSFWNSGDAYLPTNLQTIPVIGGETKSLDTEDFGADYLWSPIGDQVLVSHTDSKGGFKMNLGVMNANGGEYKNLDIPTFINKCVWSKDGKTVYYALPGGMPNNSVLPNDYKAEKFRTIDTFWKVDIATGKKTRLVDINDIKGQYDSDHLFLNPSESILFFINKSDGKLYKITL